MNNKDRSAQVMGLSFGLLFAFLLGMNALAF